ncbi:G patch domain-containing protein, putative [Pediculus humanus corporis]|uniref:G patch domain-containing protein 4 n=1 Tax=Pediculus humanus subsp. corporis TaxID=121224 RepID=E0W296_PEDHC|nr:G patch domain-containing protein, putative [Pediculus humanus corporis]EEB19752.1 G patch domain-containing protein, putative [Pediculus humanus corporis]
MEFAKKELEKYGWKSGDGLGKNKTGISKPIKTTLKFDKSGIGHNQFDVNDTWWQKVYDDAAKSIEIKKDSNEIVFVKKKKKDETNDDRQKKKKAKISDKNDVYKGFIKTSELSQGKEKNIVEFEEKDEDFEKKEKKANGGVIDLTDEELFKICGGRTGHKGARHGLKMNAKLARIENQEQIKNSH